MGAAAVLVSAPTQILPVMQTGTERVLKRAGLHWFDCYFVSGVQQLGDEFRDQYIRESTQLWGQHDGLT